MAYSVHLLIRDLLAELDCPLSSQNARALVAQRQAEGGGARWNLFNSTRAVGNCTVFNTIALANGQKIHVWNYATRADGIAATAATFRQANYAYLLAQLRRGDSAQRYWQVLVTPPVAPQGQHYDRWGTVPPGGLSIVEWMADVDRHWYPYALAAVPGS